MNHDCFDGDGFEMEEVGGLNSCQGGVREPTITLVVIPKVDNFNSELMRIALDEL